MPTSYTSLLGLALPVTGELSGTWGDTVNDYITQYLDGSVAGTQTISGSQTSVTLSKTTGTSLAQVGSGSTGSSQYSIINCTGNPASLLTITAPAASKPYIVINATSTSQQVKLVGAGPTTGVTLESGERAVVAWNGSDFVKIATSAADGVSTFSAGTTGFTPSTATSGAVTLAGTLATTNGGTGLTSFTANRVFYASSTSAIAQSANLTFDGTTLTVNNLTDSSLTSGRVTYATTGGNLTDNANFVFDGSNLGIGTSSPTQPLSIRSAGTAYLDLAGGSRTLGTNSFTFGQAGDGVVAFFQRENAAMYWATNSIERMRLDSSGNLGIGITPTTILDIGANNSTPKTISLRYSTVPAYLSNSFDGTLGLTTLSTNSFNTSNGSSSWSAFQNTGYGNSAVQLATATTGADIRFFTAAAANTNPTERMRITAAGFTQPVAYADTVVALGNTGTATTINLQNANVFTATLTGNCTFTLSNPIATGSSSFTLILTNDGTGGRTVAWAGGSFLFPGGAATLSRTTTAGAVDVWVFFTPNGGTTWYGNIAMKDVKA